MKRLSVQQVDIAIIGGGLVGASLARALVGSNLKIVVIDSQPADSLYTAGLDNRGLALSYPSSQILAELGVWSQLASQAFAIKTVHVSEQGSFGFTKLQADKFNIPALGYVLSASAIGAALLQNLEQLPNTEVIRPVKIEHLDYNANDKFWTIKLSNRQIASKLLIAADGSNSSVRSMLNIPLNIQDFQQSAVVTNINLSTEQLDIAYERFSAHGVFALLPFGKHKVKCVWTLHNSQLEQVKALTDQEFLQVIQTVFGFRLGKFISVEKRIIFPIQHLQANKLYSQNAVLIGNAANTLHPAAAQGFNLGLRDVMVLAKILREDRDLATYAAKREADHNRTQQATNNLVTLFASDLPWLKLSRRIGIVAAQFVPVLNKRITAEGLGLCRL